MRSKRLLVALCALAILAALAALPVLIEGLFPFLAGMPVAVLLPVAMLMLLPVIRIAFAAHLWYEALHSPFLRVMRARGAVIAVYAVAMLAAVEVGAQAQSCSCTDYLYVNEIPNMSGGGGEVHKFSIDPATGALTEILNGGKSWYPGNGTSELPNPHGLGVDLNGYLYIGNTAANPNTIRRLTCDGGIRPTSEFAITAAGFYLTNIGSYNGFIYSNGAGNRIYKWDPCTGGLVPRPANGL